MEKIIKNVKILRGSKILVFGGVYSNLQALEALQKVAEKEGFSPDNIICTGDIVGYCAQPSECLDVIEKWGIHAIQGNVEENLLSGNDDCGCNFRGGGALRFVFEAMVSVCVIKNDGKELKIFKNVATIP